MPVPDAIVTVDRVGARPGDHGVVGFVDARFRTMRTMWGERIHPDARMLEEEEILAVTGLRRAPEPVGATPSGAPISVNGVAS